MEDIEAYVPQTLSVGSYNSLPEDDTEGGMFVSKLIHFKLLKPYFLFFCARCYWQTTEYVASIDRDKEPSCNYAWYING